MEQLEQLKEMLASARIRLDKNPDFKLVNSLESLIEDLETAFGPIDDVVAPIVTETIAKPADVAVVEDDFLAEELKSGDAEADLTMANVAMSDIAKADVAQDSFSESYANIPSREMPAESYGHDNLSSQADTVRTADALSSKLESALDEMSEPVLEEEKSDSFSQAEQTEQADLSNAGNSDDKDAYPFNARGLNSTNGSGLPINRR